MKATSLKTKEFSCFQNDWVGLEEFTPITVIIGRNNTGKSQLLDFVKFLSKEGIKDCPYPVACKGRLDEAFLRMIFRENTSGGELGGSHWGTHGSQLLNKPVEWEWNGNGVCTITFCEGIDNRGEKTARVRSQMISSRLPQAKSPISNTCYRRILADRDIAPEPASNHLSLGFGGNGATNLIRRHITSSSFAEDLIQIELLHALDEIFGQDGEFNRIEVREHDESTGVDKERLWEVYLGEKEKGLIPLSKSGSGLKTVILVLLNLIVIPTTEEGKAKSDFVFAFEELENNLHPALLRRLLNYLSDFVSREKCRLFLTTHSNVAVDFFGMRDDSQIIHVTHDGKSANAKTITTHFERVGLVTELGSRPSDLLQANGVLWLEGPSDRIYFNRFIELYSEGDLREGRDYQCAFYGGSILANSTFTSPDDTDETFANLLRLNHNVAVVCDGDRTSASGEGSRIKRRVQRVKQEVEKLPQAFLWITDAKEIENYIPGKVWALVYGADNVPDPEKFDSFPSVASKQTDFIQKHLKRKSFDKCDFAIRAIEHLELGDLSNRFDIDEKMSLLVEKIRGWNQ